MSEKRLNQEDKDPSAFFRNNEQDVDTSSKDRKEVVREVSKVRTALGMAGVSFLLVGGGIGIAALSFKNDIDEALDLSVETKGEILEMGKAEIIETDINVQPITLVTTGTKVEGVKAAYTEKFGNDLINIPIEQTVTRTALVETEINLDPNDVTVTYDPEKDQLSFSALDTALSTKVRIEEASTIDKTGSVLALPAEWITKVSEAIDGDFGTDNSKVPIIREIAAGRLNTNEGLELFADKVIENQVQEQCTELIPTAVEDFEDQFKDAFRTAVRGEFLDPSPENVTNADNLLNEMSVPELRELIANAEVELPENFDFGPDEEAAQELEDYENSGFFTVVAETESTLECGVVKDPTLKRRTSEVADE